MAPFLLGCNVHHGQPFCGGLPEERHPAVLPGNSALRFLEELTEHWHRAAAVPGHLFHGGGNSSRPPARYRVTRALLRSFPLGPYASRFITWLGCGSPPQLNSGLLWCRWSGADLNPKRGQCLMRAPVPERLHFQEERSLGQMIPSFLKFGDLGGGSRFPDNSISPECGSRASMAFVRMRPGQVGAWACIRPQPETERHRHHQSRRQRSRRRFRVR